MRTIAVSIDEATLAGVDRLVRSADQSGRGVGSPRQNNRSRIVRQALQEFLQRREALLRDERERGVYARHRRLLARQARALVNEQAKI